MTEIVKRKVTEIIIGMIMTSIIILTGFFYNTKSDIYYLKDKTAVTEEKVTTLEKRVNASDVNYAKIMESQYYIIKTLDEIKAEIKDGKK